MKVKAPPEQLGLVPAVNAIATLADAVPLAVTTIESGCGHGGLGAGKLTCVKFKTIPAGQLVYPK